MNKVRLPVHFLLLFYAKSFLSFAFGGETCVRCGESTALLPICKKCEKILEKRSFDSAGKCAKCGKHILLKKSPDFICYACKEKPKFEAVDRLFPLWTYRVWRKRLIFLWKIKGLRSLSILFARLIEQKIREMETELGIKAGEGVVIPVPPRPGKIRAQGYDQIEDISRLLFGAFHRKICRVLKRLSKVQKKKQSRVERISSAGKNYCSLSHKKIAREFGGTIPESVFLIDDVVTTGSTIEECASILKSFGVKRVFAISLCCVE